MLDKRGKGLGVGAGHMRSSALRGETEGEAELTQCNTPLTFLGPSSTLDARISMILRQKVSERACIVHKPMHM
jgi:hypothetical protein